MDKFFFAHSSLYSAYEDYHEMIKAVEGKRATVTWINDLCMKAHTRVVNVFQRLTNMMPTCMRSQVVE